MFPHSRGAEEEPSMDRLDVVRGEVTTRIGGGEHGDHLGQPHRDRGHSASDLVDRADHGFSVRLGGVERQRRAECPTRFSQRERGHRRPQPHRLFEPRITGDKR